MICHRAWEQLGSCHRSCKCCFWQVPFLSGTLCWAPCLCLITRPAMCVRACVHACVRACKYTCIHTTHPADSLVIGHFGKRTVWQQDVLVKCLFPKCPTRMSNTHTPCLINWQPMWRLFVKWFEHFDRYASHRQICLKLSLQWSQRTMLTFINSYQLKTSLSQPHILFFHMASLFGSTVPSKFYVFICNIHISINIGNFYFKHYS